MLGSVWPLLRGLAEDAAVHWREPDQGMWEMRTEPRHFVHSKLLCWVALDRAVRLAREAGLDGPLARWRQTRDEIRRTILRDGFSQSQRSFTQSFGSEAVDATALAIPRIGFLPATDPRVLSTIDRIQQVLGESGLVHRYCGADGIPGTEGTFTLCTFWLVDALALAGRLEEAHAAFERLAGYANDVGLLSEEVDPRSGELLGNFPQGFTHLALISAAVNLAKIERHGAEHRAVTEGDRIGRARRAVSGQRSV
jgi:GH15 family glucan-1,4-alpha-glucosidase